MAVGANPHMDPDPKRCFLTRRIYIEQHFDTFNCNKGPKKNSMDRNEARVVGTAVDLGENGMVPVCN